MAPHDRSAIPDRVVKVFGIGLHKTGTTTLGACFRQLGFKSKSFDLELTRFAVRGEMDQIFRVVDRYDAFEDWPWPLVYREIDRRYPDSKFVLTTRRDSKRWLRSLKRHAAKTGPTEFRELVYGYPMPDGHDAEHVAVYEDHNRNVREYFRGRRNFVELCWENGDGWEELCTFLGYPVPAGDFPHHNRTTYSWSHGAKALAKNVISRVSKLGSSRA